MADSERSRVGYFRQRWAQENFQSQQSLPGSNHGRQGREVDLSEINAQQPADSDSQLKKAQKRSWRDNLRFSPNRLADISAPQPASTASTSLRSPVDSQYNTIYSNGELQNGAFEKEPSTPRPASSDKTPDVNNVPAWLTELYNLSWLTFFALLGTLARLGVEVITQYPNAPVTSRVLWANLGGSFFMGFLVEDRNLFGLPSHLIPEPSKEDGSTDEPKLSATHLKYKKTIPLYIGLSTGFCGSFTSFSSYIEDAFLALTNDLTPPSSMRPYQPPSTPQMSRNGGFSFLACIAILIIHPAVSLSALKAGAHLALLLRHVMPKQIFPTRATVRIINPLFVVIGLGSWIFGALFLTIFPPSSGPSPVDWRARATIPLLFAPPGCILRYYLAKYLNRPSTPNFPWGTFVANIFGTLVLGMCWDLQHSRSIGASIGGGNACAVLLGVYQGFSGCLTTVSTWVVELNGLGRRWAWTYGLASVSIALACLIVVMGSMGWTVGFANPVCG